MRRRDCRRDVDVPARRELVAVVVVVDAAVTPPR